MKSATSIQSGAAVRSSDAISRLVNLLKDPAEEWTFDTYTAMNKQRSIEIWIANIPVLDTDTYPVTINMGLLAKWKVWRALKTARNNYWLRKLNEGNGAWKR